MAGSILCGLMTEVSVWEPSVEKRGMSVSDALSRMPVLHDAQKKRRRKTSEIGWYREHLVPNSGAGFLFFGDPSALKNLL